MSVCLITTLSHTSEETNLITINYWDFDPSHRLVYPCQQMWVHSAFRASLEKGKYYKETSPSYIFTNSATLLGISRVPSIICFQLFCLTLNH